MDSKTLFLSTIIILSAATGYLFLDQDFRENSNPSYNGLESSSGDVNFTEDGTKYIVHPDNLMQGCPSRDCFPSIDEPNYIGTNEADQWIDNDEKVLKVEVGNEPRAYPLKILRNHEIVNTRIGGEPVAVTYCPLCRSGVAQNRKVKGEVLEFGVSGKLHQANLVMYDRQTETLWTQIGGKAIVGELVPETLDIERSQVVKWSDWKNQGGQVLSRDTGTSVPNYRYENNQYQGYTEEDTLRFNVDEIDNRLEGTQIVYGIETQNGSKAYPKNIVEKEKIINDEINGSKVLIIQNPSSGEIKAFNRRNNEEILNFHLENGEVIDNKGRKWLPNGTTVNKEERKKLQSYRPQDFYWFAWEKFHPNTDLYQSSQ